MISRLSSRLFYWRKGESLFVEKLLSPFFDFLGSLTTSYPVLILCISLLPPLLASLGLLKAEIGLNQTPLWVPDGHAISRNEKTLIESFGPLPELVSIIVTPNRDFFPTGNVVQKAVLTSLYYLQQNISAIRWEGHGIDEFCLKPRASGPCYLTGPLDFWQNSLPSLLADPNIYETFSWRSPTHPAGFVLRAVDVIGQITYDEDITTLIRAGEAFTLSYLFRPNQTASSTFTSFFRHIPRALQTISPPDLHVYLLTTLSVQDELEKGLVDNIWIAPISATIIVLFVCITMSDYELLRLKITVGLFTFFILVLSVTASLGLSSLFFSIPAITLQIMPCLLLSIGVDNAFVIVRTYASSSSISPSRRLPHALKLVGPSILFSTVMLLLVFAAVALINIPVTRTLCLHISLSLLSNFYLQITALPALLILDSRRIDARRVDVLCCIRVASDDRDVTDHEDKSNSQQDLIRSHSSSSRSSTSSSSSSSSAPAPPSFSSSLTPDTTFHLDSSSSLSPPSSIDFPQSTRVGRGFGSLLKVILGHRIAIAVVLFVAIALFSSSLYINTSLSIGIDLQSLIPSKSYVSSYFQAQERYFSGTGQSVFIHTPALNYTSHVVQDDLISLKTNVEALPTVSTVNLWFNNLLSWIIFAGHHRAEYEANGNRIPPHLFYVWLDEFLSAEGEGLRLYLAFQDDGTLKSTLLLCTTVPMTSTLSFVTLYESLARLLPSQSLPSFSWAPFYFSIVQFLDLIPNTIVVGLMAIVCIFLLTILVFARYDYALLFILLVVVVVSEVLATHTLLDLPFNVISVFIVVSAMGITVDYFANFTRIFDLTDHASPPLTRFIRTANAIGNPIVLGITSSLLGMSTLFFTDFELIRTYFASLWFCCVIISGLHCVFVLPLCIYFLECRKCSVAR